MRVLVTGGAGFIGSHLVDLLLSSGHDVDVLDDLSTGRLTNLPLSNGQLNVHNGSVLDRSIVDSLIARADLVYHLAAAVGVRNILVEPVRGIHVNVDGTSHVVEACSQHGVPLLFASTSEIYGKSSRLPMHEFDDRVLGSTSVTRWWYSTSKALDEHLVLEAGRQGLPVSVVRYFNSYGPRLAETGYGSVVADFIRRALAGEPLLVHGDGSQTRCFTYVTDSARGTMAAAGAADTSGRQIFNIGSTEELSIRELAERVIQTCESTSTVSFVSPEQVYGADFEDTPRRVPDPTRAREHLGWQAETKLDDGLTRTLEWWRSANAKETRT